MAHLAPYLPCIDFWKPQKKQRRHLKNPRCDQPQFLLIPKVCVLVSIPSANTCIMNCLRPSLMSPNRMAPNRLLYQEPTNHMQSDVKEGIYPCTYALLHAMAMIQSMPTSGGNNFVVTGVPRHSITE